MPFKSAVAHFLRTKLFVTFSDVTDSPCKGGFLPPRGRTDGVLHCVVPVLEFAHFQEKTLVTCDVNRPSAVTGIYASGQFPGALFDAPAQQGGLAMSFHQSLRSVFALFSAACLLLMGTSEPGFAQAASATLTGTVEDQTGAILPNVAIAVMNTDRNTKYATKTNEAGNYVLPALDPGTYSVEAVFPGFKKSVREGIVLLVNETARVDVRLNVGSVEEIVHVTAAASMLESEASSRGAVIDQ